MSDIKIHKRLNPILWTNNQINSDVRKTLLKIALAYYKFLDLKIHIIDVVVSGSQSNYNYSTDSDIDLHLIVDYGDVACDMPVDELFDTKRKLWKEQHDITIHKIPVEVYVEDVNSPAVSSTYSLIDNKWIKKPQQITADIDQTRIDEMCELWIKVISGVIKLNDTKSVEAVKDLLWTYRQAGLNKFGEMGTPNLVFKTLRNAGVTDLLLDAVRSLRDRDLSLESI